MPVFRSFPRFLASVYAAPKAMLSRLKWTLDRHSDFLENIEGEDGVEIRKNYKGGITISAEGGGGGSSYEYTSFFKVWAENVGSSVRIGVKDGCITPLLPEGKCGEIRINNTEKYVSAYQEDFTTADSSYAAYLLCWVDELLGADCEIVIANDLDANPSAPTRADPAPANIVSHGFLYLGRVSVDGAFNPTVNQDYLQGGTAQILLLGPCGGDVALYLQQGEE